MSYVVASGSEANKCLSVTILADDGYYSRPDHARSSGSGIDTKFTDFGAPLEKISKTGLGSSAALVTALVGAVIAHYHNGPSESVLTDSTIKDRIHRLAQTAHCAAQGKVGSGFDVAAAVYGSCIYRRFSPVTLEALGGVEREGFSTRLVALVNDESSTWDYDVQQMPKLMPPGLRLVMCDVDQGSKTPGMVKSVLAWRERNKDEAKRLWDSLQQGTECLIPQLRSYSDSKPDSRDDLTQTIQSVRSLVRDMSNQSGVPIEPVSQTELLDACSECRGVIGGVVPGAGGYDALALIAEDRQDLYTDLDNILQRIAPETAESGVSKRSVKILGVNYENGGLQFESAKLFESWKK